MIYKNIILGLAALGKIFMIILYCYFNLMSKIFIDTSAEFDPGMEEGGK